MEHFSPQLLQGFWSRLKEKNPKIVVMSAMVTTKNSEQKEVMWQQYRLCLAVAEYQVLGGDHFLILGPESGKILVLSQVHYLQKKYHCQWTLLRGKNPKWIFFQNFGDLLRPLEFVPVSSGHLVPTEWQVRSVLGDCISKAKVRSIRAPHSRQCALMSDFLDLAKLSKQEEAVLATNWIKDRPEGLKLQNLAMATLTGPPMSSQRKNITADVQYAVNKCESLGSGKQLVLHWNPLAIAKDCSPHMAALRRPFF